MALKAKSATPAQMMRWAESEAEKYATKENDPLIPITIDEGLLKLIKFAVIGEEEYNLQATLTSVRAPPPGYVQPPGYELPGR